jgi:hypothetical protein
VKAMLAIPFSNRLMSIVEKGFVPGMSEEEE